MLDHEQDYRDGKPSTTSGEEPKSFGSPAPDPSTDARGMHPSYWVLSEAERAKGFVRPVRNAYLHATCGSVTTMGRALAETYARQPDFYGATMCVCCGGHFPVGEHGEFTWAGTTEKVGT
jgi:hypothetical protein